MSFADSYLGGLRALVGSRPLLVAGVRVLIESESARFLCIRRADTGLWGLPSGAVELGESVEQAIHREVMEETNLTLRSVSVFGISSSPSVESHTYPNGDRIQNVAILVHSHARPGNVIFNDGEVTEHLYARADELDRETFVSTEWPTFQLWERHLQTGAFQLA